MSSVYRHDVVLPPQAIVFLKYLAQVNGTDLWIEFDRILLEWRAAGAPCAHRRAELGIDPGQQQFDALQAVLWASLREARSALGARA